MKVILALAFLVLSANAFYVMPPAFKMSDMRSLYEGFIKGVGAFDDSLELGSNCFGDSTAQKLEVVLDGLRVLEMDSALMELVPIAQNLYLVISELHTECEFYKLEHHLFNHTELGSLSDFPFHLLGEIEHLRSTFEGLMFSLTLRKYNGAGQALGALIGHLFKLSGAEKPEPIFNWAAIQ